MKRNTFKLVLEGQHYSDTKDGQRHYNKRKPQANILDEHRCKNTNKKKKKLLANRIKQHIKRIIYHNQVFIPVKSETVQDAHFIASFQHSTENLCQRN